MQTQQKYARRWHEWHVGETRILRTLDCWQIQSQVWKFRKRNPECKTWRWSTRSVDGGVEVRRVM